MCIKVRIALVLLASLSAHACSNKLADEQRAVEEWRKGRIERLTGPTGWITLVGLYWFNEGANTFGRAPTNTLVLDNKAMPDTLGTFTLANGKVTFVANAGSAVMQAGTPVTTIAMNSDASKDVTQLNVGSVQFFVIERSGKIGLRVRDADHPERKGFQGIDSYPVSTDWVFDAKFEPYNPVKQVEIINILGLKEIMPAPGAVVFTKDGAEHRLDAVLEVPDDKELFLMFADATSARETYGAGRFLYIPMPSDGPSGKHVIVDFNKAYNPPCAFNDFATCPLPPWQNRLKIAVTAGEKKYIRPGH